MQSIEMLKNARFEQMSVENCGLYALKTLALSSGFGINNVKNKHI